MVELFKGMSYLLMIVFIMISVGLIKDYALFSSLYSYVKSTFKSNRLILALLSSIAGVLPIEGRVTVSAGILDTLTTKCSHGRGKMGIVDYLATHHYYTWSPLEKTVILPMAILGVSYLAWLQMIAPILIVSLLFIFAYIWFFVKEDDIVIEKTYFKMSSITRGVLPLVGAIIAYAYGVDFILAFGLLTLYYMLITQQWDMKKNLTYINWQVLAVVAVSIVLGNFFKMHEQEMTAIIKEYGSSPMANIAVVSTMGFVASFLMGSSGKFVAIAALTSQIFGVEYFLWFFAVDYAGYLLSPSHKCVAVGNRYFGTSISSYYKVLLAWSGLMILCAGVIVFVL